MKGIGESMGKHSREYRLTISEIETTIRFDLASSTAFIYSADKAFIRRMGVLGEKHGCVVETNRDAYGCWYECPKQWIKIVPPRVLSEERRVEMRERALRNFHAKV